MTTTPTGQTTRQAFTLIEVLVVAAIISLLISILVPSLARARAQTRQVVCQSNLHQIGLGITTYAQLNRTIPFGPEVAALPPALEGNDGSLATNQVWTGPQAPTQERMGLGLLLDRNSIFPQLLFCPSDDSSDPEEELAKIVGKEMAPAFCSYMYRQLHETNKAGKLENLGRNTAGRRATALALDINSLISVVPGYRRTNHEAKRVNILFTDGAVLTVSNHDHAFSMRDQDLGQDPTLVTRRQEILQKADVKH